MFAFGKSRVPRRRGYMSIECVGLKRCLCVENAYKHLM